MATSSLSALFDRLRKHEGLVLRVYDDATGQLIVPGTVVKGHPTIGYGRALDVNGITKAEADLLLANSVTQCVDEVTKALPWVRNLDLVRAGVITEMNYQLGLGGLLKFKVFLRLMSEGRYQEASAAMLQSKWARSDSPKRALRLSKIIETGVDQ